MRSRRCRASPWHDLGCLHVELKDRRLSAGDHEAARFRQLPSRTFEIDLARDEEELFGAMSSACRRAIRKGVKEGVTVEEATGEDFAAEYHVQLVDVFAKQDLRPPYTDRRVRELIRCVHPRGRLLLLRAVSPDGVRIGTGILPALNGTAWFWGGASWREHQIMRPNEAILWYAMRRWRQRGMSVLDTGGGGDYKRKYGVREAMVPMGRRARVPGLVRLRDLAARVYTRAAFGGRP
jgi:Acetyltransferase (GNAT) domain